MRNVISGAVALGLVVGVLSSGAFAVSVTVSGLSADDDPVSVSMQADLTISSDTLTVVLSNVSPVKTASPSGLLCSFFFDIVNAQGDRPSLALVSATGDVYQIKKNGEDVLQPSKNLVAKNPGDYSWQFLSFDDSLNPFLGFGVGTVGNSDLGPNNFKGNIVGGMDYAIYTGGDLDTSNMKDRLLVKDKIAFTFSGIEGYTEADISSQFAFGLGTGPESLLRGGGDEPIPPVGEVPEPLTMALMGIGIAGMGAYVRKRRLAA